MSRRRRRESTSSSGDDRGRSRSRDRSHRSRHDQDDFDDGTYLDRYKPWDEAYQRERALRTLVCALCQVKADSEENMLKHINGGPHLKALQGFREDLCRRNAEAGGHIDIRGRRKAGEEVLPDIGMRQKDWNTRYTPGAKSTKHDVEEIRALKDQRRPGAGPSEERYGGGGGEGGSRSGSRNSGHAADLGQYRYNKRDFYCDVCDVYVGARNIMVSHMSGKEHMRRMKPLERHYCEICRVDVSSAETLQAHFNGNAHQRRALLVNQEKEEASNRHPGRQLTDDETRELYRLREENVDLKRKVENLQDKVKELLAQRNQCIATHGRS